MAGGAREFGDAQLLPGRDPVAGNVVPAAELVERDVEAVGNGDQRVPAPGGIELGAGERGGNRRKRQEDGLGACNASRDVSRFTLFRSNLVGRFKGGDADMVVA